MEEENEKLIKKSELYEKSAMRSFMLFSDRMKLADMVLASSKLLYVFPRFGIKLGFGDKLVRDVCKEYGLSLPLFLVVCNVYASENYLPDAASLHSFGVGDLLVYLHTSHIDYQTTRIPELQNKVMSVVSSCGLKGGVLRRFFDEYINEVVNHFDYEEKTVFPYIEKLQVEGRQKDFNIRMFEKNHTDIEEKLTELKNILIKYVPEISLGAQRDALRELFLFEDDLNRHSLIENHILVPIVTELEKVRK